MKERWRQVVFDLRFVIRLEDDIAEYDFSIGAISPDHLRKATALPFHHKDPFGRMIIAQAMVENLTIVPKDRESSAYTNDLLWG